MLITVKQIALYYLHTSAFFITKPTGEGTGLGLSLSYDIVTKGHGGSPTVDSQKGQGAAFVIQLPNLKQPIVVIK